MKQTQIYSNGFFQRLFSRIPIFLQLFIRNNSEIVRRLDYDKSDIYIYVESVIENEYRLRSCFHEPETVRWIERFLKKGETVFDVGANIGAYSLIMAKVHNGNNRVYSFEPNFTSFNELCKNIILNGCDKSIFPFQLALSENYGLDKLNYSSLEVGSAYHTLGINRFLKNPSKYSQPIITFSIDKFIKDFDAPSPQHIKIDVDGIEYEILKGAKNTILADNFRSLNVEIDENSENCERIISFVKSIGLSFHQKYTDNDSGDSDQNKHEIFNYIFIK